MVPFLRSLDRFVVAVTLGVATALLALMSCITLWQVLTRFLLEQPSQWSEVAARSLMIWMVYLGLVAALRQGALIAVDSLMGAVPVRWRKPLALSSAAVTIAVLAVMFWYGLAITERTASQQLAGLTNPLTGGAIPISIVYAAIPVGAALSIVAALARLAEQLRYGVKVSSGALSHDS